MWNFIQQLPLIRYLLVLRVNSPFVTIPRHLPGDLSQVLGAMITACQSTQRARLWRKSLEAWETIGSCSGSNRKRTSVPPPEQAAWPIESVWFPYPGKRVYRSGEKILCELKLLGDHAEHGIFLETILPALEAAGYKTDTDWGRSSYLWGRYDIHAVYAARGTKWEPFVEDGRLNLRYHATALQWAEGIESVMQPGRTFFRLNWVTPCDLRPVSNPTPGPSTTGPSKTADDMPTLKAILEALIERICRVMPGKVHTQEELWRRVGTEEQAYFLDAMDQADRVAVRRNLLVGVPKGSPGKWIGKQWLNRVVPPAALPYLHLASIVHVGRYTHFGCGTFLLS